MQGEENLDSWEAFEKRLEELRRPTVSVPRPAGLLFRGQSDSAWPLDTTLERTGWKDISLERYSRLIFRLRPQIESYTGAAWELPGFAELVQSVRDPDVNAPARFPDPKTFSYMVHLRHHGFPSPLLDWTRSPFVAAFFAFRSASRPSSGLVTIYAFLEMPMGLKATTSTEPAIRAIGPYVRTHRRHFRQQCDYTICVVFDTEWRFARHEAVFARGNGAQDFLWKFNIPWEERPKVLKWLDACNLNAFSLFESEESLMETLAVREVEFPEKTP